MRSSIHRSLAFDGKHFLGEKKARYEMEGLRIDRLIVFPPVVVGIDGHDHVDGVDHPRDVPQDGQDQTDAELQL